MDDSDACRVLHAIVGHNFPVYFSNAVRSVLLMAPHDDVLVIDNASKSPAVSRELASIAKLDRRIRVIERDSNEVASNAKVGGLYDAYNEVVSLAISQGYDYLHIMQHDMQLVWWDSSVMRTAQEIYQRYPECVNIHMQALPRHTQLSDAPVYVEPRLFHLRGYGLTDTGVYHLGRWRANNMGFASAEAKHSRGYYRQGLRVFCHPTPTTAAVPWPAVVRNGRAKGHEVQPREEFLLRPLSTQEIARVKGSADPVWLEDVCIPWGWAGLLPFWTTDLRSLDYWIHRYRDMRKNGLRAAWPRWDRRGLENGRSVWRVQRRPRLWLLPIALLPPWYALRRGQWRSLLSALIDKFRGKASRLSYRS